MKPGVLIAACGLVAALVGASPALASPPSPAWRISSVSEPTNFTPGSSGNLYAVSVTNAGGAVANESGAQPITVTDTLPLGLTATAISAVDLGDAASSLSCVLATLTCTDASPVRLEDVLTVYVTVTVAPGAKPVEANQAVVSGGGAPSAATTEATTINAEPAGFGVQLFTASANNADGSVDTQAGAHPYSATATFRLNTVKVGNRIEPAANLKDAAVDLPAGFIGDPLAVPRCPRGLSFTPPGNSSEAAFSCPPESQVGSATVFSANGPGRIPFPGGPTSFQVPVYNVVPDAGQPAAFGFQVETGVAYLVGRVHSNGNYEVTVASSNTTEAVPVIGVSVTLWGVPGDPLHNAQREYFCIPSAIACGNSSPPLFNGVVKPFLTNPADCAGEALAAPITTFEADSWQSPGVLVSPPPAVSPAVTGCGKMSFNPTLSVAPDTTQADSPTGLAVDLQVPQTDAPNTLATPELKDAMVTLPAGMSVSPSAGNGLQGCSDAQIALSSAAPASCPLASQIATVVVHTPLVDHPLPGAVYLGTPLCNPCNDADAASGRMLRLFIGVNDPETGVVVKLPGTVSASPSTGRLTATFKNNPQLPFSDLELQFKRGPRAPLATPQTCGVFTTASDLVPWSAPETPDATPSSSFGVRWDGTGAACPASPPFAPSFNAGTVVPKAGGYSPFTLTLARADREQDLSQVQVHMPPGLLGTLSSVPLCPEPQAAQGTCSQASRIGTTTVAAGPGSDPFYLSGPVYLTGPYNGAPFGLSVAVPAVAGPFNLGTVVVRAAITIDPLTAAVTVTSGALPQIIDGVPVRLRTVNVTVDRPGFIFNPTNCSAHAVTATVASAQGATAPVSSPFAVGGCASLPFKPRFTASTQAKTSKANGASLTVRVASSPGQANIAKVFVQLPSVLPSRLTTLQKACTEAQFNANPAGCPAGSVIGMAKAITPVLNVPLTGPAILVSHGGAAFPDVEFILQGQGVTVVLDGKTQIKKGVTYSHFDTVPDAPISSFETVLPEGPHSVLAAYTKTGPNGSFCGASLVMPATLTGQSGAVVKQNTKIAVTNCPKVKKAKKARKARSSSRSHQRSNHERGRR